MTATQRRLKNLKPFKPGECGTNRRSKRYLELRAALFAEFGDDLTAIDAALLDQVITLMCRAERPGTSVEDIVRCSNAASRLLAKLQDKRREHKRDKRRPLAAYLDGADEEVPA